MLIMNFELTEDQDSRMNNGQQKERRKEEKSQHNAYLNGDLMSYLFYETQQKKFPSCFKSSILS